MVDAYNLANSVQRGDWESSPSTLRSDIDVTGAMRFAFYVADHVSLLLHIVFDVSRTTF